MTRSAFGGVSGFFAPAAPGTHQLRQSTVSVAVAFAGNRCRVDAGGRTWGNAAGWLGNGSCRWAGCGDAPTTRTVGRPVNRQAADPELRRVTLPVPPDSAGENRNPVPTTFNRAARHGAAGATGCATSCAGAAAVQGTSAGWLGRALCADVQPASATAAIGDEPGPPTQQVGRRAPASRAFTRRRPRWSSTRRRCAARPARRSWPPRPP